MMYLDFFSLTLIQYTTAHYVICYVSMRFVGIDYGTKRVGLALSDESGTMAFPHAVIPNDRNLLKTLVALIEEKGVEAIVVGHSLDLSGNPNKLHTHVESFIQDLTLETGLPVHLEPEQYTTQEARRVQGKNNLTDASAATLILNSYLQKIRS